MPSVVIVKVVNADVGAVVDGGYVADFQTLLSNFCLSSEISYNTGDQWKRINCKQIARWQHLSRLKASAFLFEFFC